VLVFTSKLKANQSYVQVIETQPLYNGAYGATIHLFVVRAFNPMQKIPISVRIRALFARDKEAFWWNHFTDEEKKLREMDVWELAQVINEARVHNLASEAEKLIVAEHMLNVRLAKIQATASWGSGLLGFIGAILGAALSVSLTTFLLSTDETQTESVKLQSPVEPITQQINGSPNNEAVELTTSAMETENEPTQGKDTQQPNGTKP